MKYPQLSSGDREKCIRPPKIAAEELRLLLVRLGDPLLQELANPSSPPPTQTENVGESENRGPQQSDDVSADSGAANNANMRTWFLITLGILFHI